MYWNVQQIDNGNFTSSELEILTFRGQKHPKVLTHLSSHHRAKFISQLINKKFDLGSGMEHKTCECPVDILKREMGLENGLESDDVVYKRELNNAGGTEVSVRRVFVLYGSYRIGWVHDADVQHCMLCRSDFGFFKRKHHCRACGSVICR